MSTVLITGANRGIGLALAQQFKARGDEVIAVCRESSKGLDQLDVRVEENVDVTDLQSIKSLHKKLGDVTLDILVNNAGLLVSQSLGEIDAQAIDDMQRQYLVNAIGPLLVTQTLLQHLEAGSKVFIVTSRVGSIADNDSGGTYGYRMSKAAANMAGKSLAQDLKERRIAVGLLHPGYVRTDMTGGSGHVETDEAAAGLIERIDALSLDITGTFWHAKGQELPW